MARLLDNNAYRAIARGDAAFLRRLSDLPEGEVFLSAIAIREAVRGLMENLGANEKQGARGLPMAYDYLLQFLQSLIDFDIHPYTEEADALYSSWSGKGSGPGQNDWRIAASAVSAGMIVVTADRHFAKIQHFVPELIIEDWSQPQ